VLRAEVPGASIKHSGTQHEAPSTKH
jgi:hypothetical protein